MLTTTIIKRAVELHFDMLPGEIDLPTRRREIVLPRQIAHHMTIKLMGTRANGTGRPALASIGADIGGKDHATVLHSNKTILNLMQMYPEIKHQVDMIEAGLTWSHIPQL